MDILQQIIANKKLEIAKQQLQRPIEELEKSIYYKRKTFSLRSFLLDENRTGIIAEFKRRSPSKGIINNTSDVATVAKAYTDNGASCLSILTDEVFFGGKKDDLMAARENSIPILRKDFIIDEYQIVEAKAIGADVILLIAACLLPEKVQELAKFAHSLNMEVLLEIHNEDELQHICDETLLIGVNNRDLKTFSVDVDRSIALSKKIPYEKIRVAESGLHDVRTIRILRQNGFKGFLMGEYFMKTNDPGLAFADFVQQLKQY